MLSSGIHWASRCRDRSGSRRLQGAVLTSTTATTPASRRSSASVPRSAVLWPKVRISNCCPGNASEGSVRSWAIHRVQQLLARAAPSGRAGRAQTSAIWRDGDPLHVGGERLGRHRAPRVRCQEGGPPTQAGPVKSQSLRSCGSSSVEADGTRVVDRAGSVSEAVLGSALWARRPEPTPYALAECAEKYAQDLIGSTQFGVLGPEPLDLPRGWTRGWSPAAWLSGVLS